VGSNPTPRTFCGTLGCGEALGEILSFGLWMRKQGYRESTIRPCVRALKAIAKRTNLLNSESVKTYLASAVLSENRKAKLTDDLARFYRYKQIAFDRPRYRRIEKLPFIPLESEVDQLIAGLGNKTATFLQLLKETGMRPGEAWNLRWIDVDHPTAAITITPEKGSKPRRLKMSSQLSQMLQQLRHSGECVFRGPGSDLLKSMENFHRNFCEQRRQLAKRLQNPRLDGITFRTFRHFKATMEYHRTKDILHVMQLLGHRSIKNTLVYTHLVDFGGDEFVCKAAKNVEEAKVLVETGFDYVTDIDCMKLFRKRK
jgi:integrase